MLWKDLSIFTLIAADVFEQLTHLFPMHPLFTHSFLWGWNPHFSEGTTPPPPPFLGTPSFWSKFKKLPHSFWEPSKLVHVNSKKHFKMKVLRFVSTIQSQLRVSLTLLFLLSGSTLYLLLTLFLVRYCLQCFSYLMCKINKHETFLITILLNLMCV